MAFSLATWNINSVRLRAGLVERYLASHQPDVLCLQEIKCMNDQFPGKFFRNLGYEHQAVHGQKGYHGVAILSKRPLQEVYSLDYCEMGDTRHIAAHLDIGGTKTCLHNFYVPAGGDEPDPVANPKFAHKLQFIDEMKTLKARTGDIPSILVGDLNIAPYENDVWSHRQLLKIVSHTPVETEGLLEVLNRGEWVDLMRQHVPMEEKLFTWWSYRSRDWTQNNRGRRLDHIWSDAGISQKLVNIEVLNDARSWEKPSDHVPVLATFDLQ
jgi:exodeoxyribonuclease-3